jgi:hypothetical protein
VAAGRERGQAGAGRELVEMAGLVGQQHQVARAEGDGQRRLDRRRGQDPPGEGGRQGRADAGQLQGHPAAERVPGHVRGGDAELVEQPGDGRGQGGRCRFDPGGERLGAAEPGQVDGDDVEVLGQRRHHRVPGVAGQPEGVQQD